MSWLLVPLSHLSTEVSHHLPGECNHAWFASQASMFFPRKTLSEAKLNFIYQRFHCVGQSIDKWIQYKWSCQTHSDLLSNVKVLTQRFLLVGMVWRSGLGPGSVKLLLLSSQPDVKTSIRLRLTLLLPFRQTHRNALNSFSLTYGYNV